MLKTEYFKYVIEIERAGTIHKAAERLFVSQPYLSLELKTLEQKLGVSLFIRTNKGISLTPAGEEFLTYAHQICDLMARAESLQERSAVPQEKLVISSMYSFTILDLYNNFASQEHVGGGICYEEIPNETIVERVYRGVSDIGIMYVRAHQLERVKQSFAARELNFVALANEPLCAVFNRENPLAGRESVGWEELEDASLIMETPTGDARDSSVLNIISPLVGSLKRNSHIHFDNNRSLLYYITKNPGCYTVGQKLLNTTNPFVVSGELVYVPIKGLKDTLVTGYLTNENIPSSRLQEKFIDQLEKFFLERS